MNFTTVECSFSLYTIMNKSHATSTLKIKGQKIRLSRLIYFRLLTRIGRKRLRWKTDETRSDISSPDTGNTTFEDIEEHDA